MELEMKLRLPSQNFVLLIGRLVRDAEFRRTTQGIAICSFDIAIGKRVIDPTTGFWKDGAATFVPVIIFGEQAEKYELRLLRGVPVQVEGRLQTVKWEGKDGLIRSRLECKASKLQILALDKDIGSSERPENPIEQPTGSNDAVIEFDS